MDIQPVDAALEMKCSYRIGHFETRNRETCDQPAVVVIIDPEDPEKENPRCAEHRDQLHNPNPHSYFPDHESFLRARNAWDSMQATAPGGYEPY